MRARNIKPGFYKNEELADCSMAARLLAPGLWMMADRAGRLEDRPKRIKGEIFPYDDIDVNSLLDELVSHNHIQRYEVGGKRFIQIQKFSEHQKPHQNETASTFPDINHSVTEENKALATKVESTWSLTTDSLNDESLLLKEDDDVPPSIDFKKIIFDSGLKFLSDRTSKKPESLRPILGKWCKEWGDSVTAAAIMEAQKFQAVDPISFIERQLRGKTHGKPRFAEQDYRAGTEGFIVA